MRRRPALWKNKHAGELREVLLEGASGRKPRL